METYLTGNVLWSFDYELEQAGLTQEMLALFSLMPPIHRHEGQLSLTDVALIIEGDISKTIPLSVISQLYLGFDEVFRQSLVKNGGVFWQPLRLTLEGKAGKEIVYLIIDHGPFGAKNTIWFNALKDMLAE